MAQPSFDQPACANRHGLISEDQRAHSPGRGESERATSPDERGQMMLCLVFSLVAGISVVGVALLTVVCCDAVAVHLSSSPLLTALRPWPFFAGGSIVRSTAEEG